MTPSNVVRVVGATAAVLISLLISWSAAYVIMSLASARFGFRLHPLVFQLINSVLGILILAGVGFGTSYFPRERQKQVALWQSLNEAMQQIARGNFDVNVKFHRANDHFFGELAGNINHMAMELNQMEHMRQEFISNVSHELQSPLTSINGFARALQSDGLSQEERTHYLNVIEAETMRLSRLSENLLKLATLESEQLPFERKRYRLDKQLRDVVLSFEPQWMAKSLELDVALEEVSVAADEDLMSQVWVNLFTNSIKFTPDGGTIGISLQKDTCEAVVHIFDTGIGIAEDDQVHIFERFYMADRSRNRHAGGSGLGLAIAKKITDLHQGTIHVESKLGEGTRLTLHLPIGH